MLFRGTLQDIRLFVAAYEEGSFTAAGTRENTAQSGVSQHIRNLEEAYGVRLFLREKTRVVPTPAADTFYRRCVVMLRELNEGANDLRRFSDSFVEQITVGVVPALNRRIIASTLLRYEQVHPNVKVRIVEAMSPQFPAFVKSGEVDFALCVPIDEDRGIRTTPIFSIPDCLLSRSSPGDRDALMHHLPDQPLKICWASGGFSRRHALTASLNAAGLSIGQQRELDSAFATLDLVCRSDWVTVGPSVLLDPVLDAGRYSLFPLKPQVSFDVVLLEDKTTSLTEGARAFIEIVRAEVANAIARWDERFDNAGL